MAKTAPPRRRRGRLHPLLPGRWVSFLASATMRIRFRYIFSFLLILSFFGFGESIPITCASIKNIKETEWVTKANANTAVSKCYHYNQFINFANAFLNLHSWSIKGSIYYNRIISIKFLTQTKVFSIINNINLISNKLSIPRRSIEYHTISSCVTDLKRSNCLSCLIWHDQGNIMWNYILKRKWINQKTGSPVISIGLNAS